MTIVVATSAVGAASSDVPNKYDVVIDGHGYMMLDAAENPFPGASKARFGYSPTFVERTNVQGDYGDNQQDFFLTIAQRDWSLGEQLKFSRRDDERSRRYFSGTNLDITIQGQVQLRQAVKSLTFANAVRAVEAKGAGSGNVYSASTANLYETAPDGAITDRSAHGLGAAPSRFGLASDGTNLFLSTTAAGTVGVRKWNGSTFSTFSANGSDVLEYLNNTLYGFDASTSKLVKWDSAGTRTDIFQWKTSDGNARAGNFCRLKGFGGKLLCLWSDGPDGPELWIYDGGGTYLIAQLPPDFYAADMTVGFGTVFISGSHVRISAGNTSNLITRPAVYYYANGQYGQLWIAENEMGTASTNILTAAHPSIAVYTRGVVWNDDTRGQFTFYNAASGGEHSIGAYTVAGDTPLLAASQRFLLHTRNQTGGYMFPDTTTIAASGVINSALIDFDSSLSKYFKSIQIDADIPAGASIDIAYQLNALDGAYTTLVTGAASGSEYAIGQSARSIGYQVTLNKGTAATSPTLKRVYIRAAPALQTFRLREYILNCTGRDGRSPVTLRNQDPHPKDGKDQVADLLSSVAATSPVTITDTFGTFSGILEPDGFELQEIHVDEFIAKVRVREV